MTRLPSGSLLAALALALAATGAGAALEVGRRAPDFSAPAALAGKRFDFSLGTALAKGPVVVYFFPAAFTTGCSIEAHEFAEAMPQFEGLGASVIGVSTDDIETLARFSVEVCQNRFAVASDARKAVVKAYDAQLAIRPDYADRISYLLGPDGTILARHVSLSPDKHVQTMLAALREWRQTQPRK